jgi:SAM-dependent methyltransferase
MDATCGVCGSANTSLWLKRAEWSYYRCGDCSAVWLYPIPADSQAEAFYDREYFTGGGRGGYQDYLADEAQHRSNARMRVTLAQRFGATPPASWLDVGCAVGFTLDEARKYGFKVLGVEPSSWARAIAHDRFGLNVFTTISEAHRKQAGVVDVVSMFQVLEHTPDPVAALRDARTSLRPGGLLVIETWDRSSWIARLFGGYWQQITPPSVLWLFDRKSLVRSLERAGFRPRAILRTSKKVSVRWMLGLLADKAPKYLRPMLRALAGSALGQFSIVYDYGDLISIVASSIGLM